MSFEETLKILKDWWKKLPQDTPYTLDELIDDVKVVYERGYEYGCRTLQNWCNHTECRFSPKGISEEALEIAEEMLKSPDLICKIKKLLDKVIVGEDDNKLLAFILGLSGIRPFAEEKQIVTYKAEPGAGKSHIIREAVSKVYNVKERGRFSPTAIEYGNLQNYDILVLKELFGEEHNRLRLLSADDRGYIAEITVRGDEGFTTTEIVIPPITIFTSTARIALSPEFERRSWLISWLDTSEEQTKRIWEFKAKKHEEQIKSVLKAEKQKEPNESMIKYGRSIGLMMKNILEKFVI